MKSQTFNKLYFFLWFMYFEVCGFLLKVYEQALFYILKIICILVYLQKDLIWFLAILVIQ